MITIGLNTGCRRVNPCRNLDQVDSEKFESNTSCQSWRRDKEKCEEDREYPVRSVQLSEYQPKHNRSGAQSDLRLHSGSTF
jgi:hypothetical protein